MTSMSETITHARIRTLLEIVEDHEKDGTPIRSAVLHPDEAIGNAELDWLRDEALVRTAADEEQTETQAPALTAFGRGTLALMRGEA